MGRRSAEVDSYLSLLDEEKQKRVALIRDLVHQMAPSAVEVIKYRMPTFVLPGKGDILSVAAFKAHIGLYPQPEAIVALQADLAGLKTSKGAIQLPLETPLPLELIAIIIGYRLNLLQEKQ